MFNTSEDMLPDHKKTIKKSIKDEDLKFLKGVKILKARTRFWSYMEQRR